MGKSLATSVFGPSGAFAVTVVALGTGKLHDSRGNEGGEGGMTRSRACVLVPPRWNVECQVRERVFFRRGG